MLSNETTAVGRPKKSGQDSIADANSIGVFFTAAAIEGIPIRR